MTYTQAHDRLEQILESIESGETPIDDLLEKIKEANVLISYCREKLKNIDAELESLNHDKE